MWEQLIPQLIAVAAPVIAGIIRNHHQATGEIPTDEQIRAELLANVEKYLGEGAAWKASHPET